MNKPVILAAGTPQVLLPYDSANRFVRSHRAASRGRSRELDRALRSPPKTSPAPEQGGAQIRNPREQLRGVNRIPARMLVWGRLDAAESCLAAELKANRHCRCDLPTTP
jgi:membrane-bound lytic murein transglycosylase D